MITLNTFLTNKGFKEKITFLDNKATHCLELDRSEAQNIFHLYTPQHTIPTDLSEDVILRSRSFSNPSEEEIMSFYEALVRLFPNYQQFNPRMFIGTPKFYHYSAVKTSRYLEKLISTDAVVDGSCIILFDSLDTYAYYELTSDGKYYVIIENRDGTFDTAEEAETFLFSNWMIYQNAPVLKYNPILSRYLCVWGEGYSPKEPEELTIEEMREMGFGEEDIQTIKALHRGESHTFSEGPVPQFMSVIRIG